MKKYAGFFQSLGFALKLKWAKRKRLFRKSRGLRAFVFLYILLAIASLFLCLLITQSPASSQSTNAISQPELSAVDPQNLVQQGKALYAVGQLIEAAEILRQAAQVYQRQGDDLRQAIALSNLALIYQKSGLFSEAQ